MKISLIKFIAFFFFFQISNIIGQKYSNDEHLEPRNNVNKVYSQNSINQDWDITFNHEISTISGVNGYAGVVYEEYFDEIWTTVWNSNRFDIWSISGSSITHEGPLERNWVNNVRGMTYDGEIYIYTANNSDTIKIIAKASGYLGDIIAPFNIRYVSYDPSANGGKGGFWIGNWEENPTLIDRDGNILRSLDYSNLGITSIYGGAYDYFSSDGPFLWLWGHGDGRGNPQYIVQIDPSSGLPTGVQHDVMSDVGVAQDSSIAGGLFISDQLIEGKIILGGILQGYPDLLFGYDIGSSSIPPTATTGSATSITTTSAVLNGTVNPNGLATGYVFSYGTSTDYDNLDYWITDLTGSDPQPVNANISGLTPNTLYHFELSAANDAGDSFGGDVTFMTASEGNTPPLATTNAATNIGPTTATLNGTINPNGTNTTYYFEYGTSTSYGNTISGSVSYTVPANINVDENISGLNSNTTYHYRIVATSSAGITNGNDVTFTTTSQVNPPPLATTNGATSIGTTTATLNGTINPNGLNTTYIFEYGTSTSYGNTKAGSSSLTGTTNVNVSENITGLLSNTPYHYRIVATNSGGTTNGSDVTFTTNTTGTSDINLVLTKIFISTFTWEIGSSVQVNLTAQNIGSSPANPHITQLYLSTDNKTDVNDISVGNPISFPSLAPGDTILMSETFTVPNINSSGYFLMASIDVNNSVEETDENNGYYNTYQIILGYPSSIQVSNTFTFNDPNQSSSYRMIGLPGNNNISISTILPGSSGEDWIAYYDNGTVSDYLVEYDATGTFNFAPGKGFWVLSKGAAEINSSSQTLPLEYKLVQINDKQDNRIVTPINVHNEWNIITNPFEIDISWAEVQVINNISVSLHSFEGSFSASSILQPYKGYYFNNVTNLSDLYIPYSVFQGLPKSNLIAKETAENLLISLKSNKEVKSTIHIGFNDNSQNSYDSLDSFIPPGDFEEKRISIYNSNIETEYKYLSKDYRNPNKNHIYEIEIKYPIGENYDLIIDEIGNIGSSNVYLVGPNVNFVNLDSKSSLQLISSKKINKYTLLIGSDEFIENQRNQLLPREYSLSQNYPNPFNPNTRIVYSIPEESFVSLRVFDILGKEIVTLVNDQKQAGKYEVNFEGDNLSSGIYFYTLNAVNPETSSGQVFVETKKMILLQ